MLRPGNPAYKDPRTIAVDVIPNACAALYGVRPENVLPELCEAVIVWLEGKDLTIADIQEAFKTTEVRKVPYVGISRDEILEPIRAYWRKKSALLEMIKRVEAEDREREQSRIYSEQRNAEAWEIFKTSYIKGEWTGSEWQAATIRSREFFTEIDIRIGRLFWKQSQYEDKQRRYQMNNGIGALLPTSVEFIFSQKWLAYVCSRKINITLLKR